MSDEMIDVEVNLGKEMAQELNGLTKKELLGRLVVMCLRNRVQDETVNKLETEKDELQTKLDKAESYVEQGRAMIQAVMERWYEYDT